MIVNRLKLLLLCKRRSVQFWCLYNLHICHKRMLQQLRHSVPVPWILLQANQNEILGIIANWSCLWKSDLIFNDLDEISLSGNIERHTTKQEFIGQYADAPYVDLIVVVFSFEELWWYVQRSAAKCLPHGLWADWPSEITQFYHPLK